MRIDGEKGYKPDSGVVSQIKVIKRLFDTSEHIIVATDAGREGELSVNGAALCTP